MGQIQSAITGIVMSSLGAIATHKKVMDDKAKVASQKTEGSNAAKKESDALNKSSTSSNNVVKRQEQANDIAKKFVESRKKQKEKFGKKVLMYRNKRIKAIKEKRGKM